MIRFEKNYNPCIQMNSKYFSDIMKNCNEPYNK